MPADETALKMLLRKRHWQKYATFCAEYDRAATTIDPRLVGTWPSRAQLHRWISGSLRTLPYPDHCRVLETMFHGRWTAEQLFGPPPTAAGLFEQTEERRRGTTPTDETTHDAKPELGGITGAFTTRAEFSALFPPYQLFDGAASISAAGLSLNFLCQQYPVPRLCEKISDGSDVHCLFLDPDGKHVREREKEEGYREGELSALTSLNIQTLLRARSKLDGSARKRFRVGVYDETVRYNIIIVDNQTCVVQLYLPSMRGIDSPTLTAVREENGGKSIFGVFAEVQSSLAERSRFL